MPAIDNNHRYADQTSLACDGPSPSRMTGFFLQMLMMHFSDARHIGHPSLKEYTYAPENLVDQQVRSKLVLTTLTKFNAASMFQRPAIIVKRKGFSIAAKDVIGGKYHNIRALLDDPQFEPNNWATAGEQMFEFPVNGQFQFVCLHQDGAAAELLGEEVFNLMAAWCPMLLSELNLWDFFPLTLGEQVKVEEAKDHWATVVSLSVAYRQRVVWRPNTPLLKRIAFNAGLAGEV